MKSIALPEIPPGGALDPSAVSGDPPETLVTVPAPADAPAAAEAASTPSFRRVAEKSTRVECSTRTCRLTIQRDRKPSVFAAH